jgi:uncharacterized protein (DUF1015 family)
MDKEILRLKKKIKSFLEITLASGPHQYRLFQVKEKESAALIAMYQKLVPKLYIADGHHRCSTSEKLLKLQGKRKGKDYRHILAAIFPFEQLDILDYNRTVQLPYHFKLTRFMAEVSRFCHIKALHRPAKPRKKHDLTMYLNDEWYQLTWKEEVLKKYKKQPAILDAHLLDKEILEGVLGIIDISTDMSVDYIPGNLGAVKVQEKARVSEQHVGFCIYPVQFSELVKVSDHHGALPPKSTWFEPRMINGLIVKAY